MTENKETKRSNKKKLGLIMLLLLLIGAAGIEIWQLQDRDPAPAVQTPSVTLPDTDPSRPAKPAADICL